MACDPTPLIESTALRLIRRLHAREPGERLVAEDLAHELDVSPPTVHRALRWLRKHHDAPLEFERHGCGWSLPPEWRPILEAPEPEDIAVLRTFEALALELGLPPRAAAVLGGVAEGLERRLAGRDG